MAVINKITKAVKKVDTSGFGNPRANPIGPKILKSKPINDSKIPSSDIDELNKIQDEIDNLWLTKIGNDKFKSVVNKAKDYKQQKATSNTTQPLQSGPVSADDFAVISGSSNRASDYMGKRLARKYNETDARIQVIQNDSKLPEADKTKQINEIYASFGDNVKNMNDVQQSLFEQAKRGPSAWDYAMGYKVPQAITGVTLLGGMASMALGNSKGQKTNAELYSNPF